MSEPKTKELNGHKLCACGLDSCFPCKHGLGYCLVCRGGEGELPSECPGVAMTEIQREGVFDGRFDYLRGRWVKIRLRRRRRR